MKIDVITIFPQMYSGILRESILGRAQKHGILSINVHDLRDFSEAPKRQLDDRPFGGGAGMVMMIDPVYRALRAVGYDGDSNSKKQRKPKIIVMSARGRQFDQKLAKELSKEKHLVFVAPHYEGIDQRVIDHFADYEICIGPYILTGGELPSLLVIDATARLIPGVVGKSESVEMESFAKISVDGKTCSVLEYPQYTRPEVFETDDGKKLKVPEVLVSGDHQRIREWRVRNMKCLTS